jgi:hypothetical protein
MLYVNMLYVADEEEKFKKAKELVEKVKDGLKDAKEKGMEGPIWSVLQNISDWMEITTGVQETTANVVVDSYNKVASPPRKSRRDSSGGERSRPSVMRNLRLSPKGRSLPRR